ncbi:MAG: transposase, partial [Sandaracinaceae bacterium]
MLNAAVVAQEHGERADPTSYGLVFLPLTPRSAGGAHQRVAAAECPEARSGEDSSLPGLPREALRELDGVEHFGRTSRAERRGVGDGRLPLDNNVSERELRRQAVGRKNWIFLGSDDGGHVNATFTSLLASCRMVGVEPWAYLRDLLCLLPRWSRHQILELAPASW